ncbi:MAG: VTT domain-containing protein [Candidatus Micrarchaeota archaeon]
MAYDKVKGLLQIIFAVALIVIILAFSDKLKEFEQFGYAGVFIVSMLSSATLFIPAPGWAIVIAMAGVLNPYIVGIVAGIGSALGETTGYIAGSGAEKMIHDEKLKKHRKYLEMIKKNDIPAIFILAFIPNPLFDIAGIAAGGLGISLPRFLFSCALGRIARYILLAYLGTFALEYI